MPDTPAAGLVSDGTEAPAPDPRPALSYMQEFAVNRRALAAAFVGMASGYTINNYTNNVFIPPLMDEFGWSSADVALTGAAAMLSVIFQPLAGRITDSVGVRKVALFGTLAATVQFLLFSVMDGSFGVFLALTMLQVALVASTTGAVVFSRPLATNFQRARGLALALAICAPSLAGAFLVPPLATLIAQHGWRTGYQVCALATLIFGLFAVALVPRMPARSRAAPIRDRRTRRPPIVHRFRSAVRQALTDRAMIIILTGMILCSLSISLQTTQLKVVLLSHHLGGPQTSLLISIYALGVILGRLASGIALDILPTRIVAATAMSLPAVGLFILTANSVSTPLLLTAMLTLGLSLGAEGDIAGFLVVRYCPSQSYGMNLGVVIGAIALASGVGGLLLSATLALTGGFRVFLTVSGVAALIGGMQFLRLELTRNAPRARGEP